jgi:hypothetical protein
MAVKTGSNKQKGAQKKQKGHKRARSKMRCTLREFDMSVLGEAVRHLFDRYTFFDRLLYRCMLLQGRGRCREPYNGDGLDVPISTCGRFQERTRDAET